MPRPKQISTRSRNRSRNRALVFKVQSYEPPPRTSSIQHPSSRKDPITKRQPSKICPSSCLDPGSWTLDLLWILELGCWMFTALNLEPVPMNAPTSLFLFTALALITTPFKGSGAEKPSLAERLGYQPTDKLLIVNGDDAGMCHAANLGTIECLEKGSMRSATIMVPCPWFPEIAAYAKAHPEKDFGIHLCHTSEWGKYRWGPVEDRSKVPGLVDSLGYLWREVPEVYDHATPDQALIEGRAQIQRALAAGVDVTHLDSHMGTLQYDPRYLQMYLQLG